MRRGFTLLELLVAVALALALAGLGLWRLGTAVALQRVHGAALQVAADVERAREAARRTQRAACWQRLDDRRYRLLLEGSATVRSLPKFVFFLEPPPGARLCYYPPAGEFPASTRKIVLGDRRGHLRKVKIVGVTGKVIVP